MRICDLNRPPRAIVCSKLGNQIHEVLVLKPTIRPFRIFSFIVFAAAVATLQLTQELCMTSASKAFAEEETQRRPQKAHNLELSVDEINDLENRQATIRRSSEAFLRASGEWQTSIPTTAQKKGDDAVQDKGKEQAARTSSVDWYSVIKPIRDATIGYVWEGRHGEFMYCFTDIPGSIRIVRNDGGLELLKTDENGVPVFIGIVRNTGEYIPFNNFREKGTRVDNTPFYWNTTEKSGALSALQKDSPVLCAKPGTSKRPRGALGWLFPTKDGHFVVAGPSIEPIENVVWVVRISGGMKLKHSGPDHSGLYARISQDGVVSFEVPFGDAINTDWSNATWNILDENQSPTFDTSALTGNIIPARLELSGKMWISERGWISQEGPVITD